MRKVRNIALVALVAIGGLYLVSSGSAKPLAPELRIGVLVSDSGSLGFAGPYQRAAAKLATKELVDQKFQVKIDLKFVDVGDSPSENLRAVSKLKALECDVVVAPIESDSARDLVRSNSKTPMPIIAPSSLDDFLGKASSNRWIFRLASSPSQDSFALSSFITRSVTSNILLVSGSQEQSRDQLEPLLAALDLEGIKPRTLDIKDIKTISKTKPNALVLLGMEDSLTFFSSLEEWVARVPQVFLVPSNLADYSAYSWAKSLKGTQALSPRNYVSSEFKSNLGKSMGNQVVSGPRATAVIGLAQNTYQAVKLAAEARLEAGSNNPEELRVAISKSLREGQQLFNKLGFFGIGEYYVFRYGSGGTYVLSSIFNPN
jgi:ABC-type branched-subunit amino acid transport system substrate-binding protein